MATRAELEINYRQHDHNWNEQGQCNIHYPHKPIHSTSLVVGQAMGPAEGAMVHGIIIATMLTLVGDNGSGDQVPAPPQPPSYPAQVSMKAADWTLKNSHSLAEIADDWDLKHGGETTVPMDRWNINHRPTSVGTRLSHPSPDPQGGWSLSLDSLFPRSKFSLSYLVTTASPILTQGQYVKMVGEISARGEVALEPPLHTLPAQCGMYFREVDDDPFYRKTHHLHYRWWSNHGVGLYRGRFVLVVGLEPQFWSNVVGEPGDYSAAATAGFQKALANPHSIGITCSGGYVPSGPYVSGDGSMQSYFHALTDSTFSMFSFAVCDPFRGGATSDFADAPSAKQENEACAPEKAR
jgi:hypothetical protein